MGCKPAAGAVALGKQMDRHYPERKRRVAMEGICGDAAHRKRASDHNPNTCGCCHARDLTYDARYMTPAWCKGLARDRRVKYVILMRRLYSHSFPHGRRYLGSNPHTDHAHVSLADSHVLHASTAPFPLLVTPPFRYVIVRGDLGRLRKVAGRAKLLNLARTSKPSVGGAVFVAHARPRKASLLASYARKIGLTNIIIVNTFYTHRELHAYLDTLH